MKINFLFIYFILICTCLKGQADRTRYSLQSSFYFSDAAGLGPAQYFDPGLGYNITFTTELASKRASRFTIGAGYLQSKLVSTDFHSHIPGFVEQHHNLYFLVVPGGTKFSFGSFYIHPEIAATYFYNAVTNTYLLDADMNKPDEPFEHDKDQQSFELSLASFMTFGYEIKVNSTTILTGLKGYFAFENNYVNTFGIGLTVGVKI